MYKWTKNPESRSLPAGEAMAKWMKKNLFPTPAQSMLSIILFSLILKMLTPFLDWFVYDAVWLGSADDCRQASGACVAFIREKFTFILFGFYPREYLWRPIAAIGLFICMLWYSKEPSRWSKRLVRRWVVYVFLWILLMRGGMFGFELVPSNKWGGLPLTLMLSFVGIVFSYPFGILLALGRRSKMPVIKAFCVGYIELIRGVPLISLLFMSSVMFPLFLPEGVVIDKLLRAQAAIILFVAAYMAEVVRGGLAAIPKGQYEAGEALGLSFFQIMRLIILPQALKIVIPPTVNTAIGMFKDTSLVLIIALFDLLNTTKTALKDGNWLGFSVEGYLFVALIYFIFCFSMGKYSRRLEYELTTSRSH
ncbi:MAG: amino acid ABC transporter permease [Halobacteriovoraceae bacterium]|jgi:general L-amino acid transport system permease protein|nr:amino acid ABC transporter permease [Halobacteriovoraceae bacterium]